MAIMTKKRCTRCNELKVVTQYPDKGMKRSVRQYGAICNECLQLKEVKIVEEKKKKTIVVNVEEMEQEIEQAISTSGTIVCNECGESKPQGDFYKDRVSNGIQRYRGECKICSQKTSKERTKKYNEQKASLISDFTETQWQAACKYFKQRCAYCCDNPIEDQDHVVPVKDGGGYTVGNILPACHRCNASKGSSQLPKWYVKMPWFTKEKFKNILVYLKNVQNN
jgi:hypothetical protein